MGIRSSSNDQGQCFGQPQSISSWLPLLRCKSVSQFGMYFEILEMLSTIAQSHQALGCTPVVIGGSGFK
jgi:hypothetical protein